MIIVVVVVVAEFPYSLNLIGCDTLWSDQSHPCPLSIDKCLACCLDNQLDKLTKFLKIE